jgi:hypothetical protein
MRFSKVAARALAATVSISALGLAALTNAGPAGATTTPVTYYVSVGDSYSVGYQPLPAPHASAGYTGYVATKLKMTLVNFGCGGATTVSILDPTALCNDIQFGPPAATDVGVVPPGESQIQAADAFIAAHVGHIGLITVSIGGNDVTPCVNASPTNPVNGQTTTIGCVGVGVTQIQANVGTLVGDLHAAAGSAVPIVGLTYPDVLLGLLVYPTFPASSADQSLASLSIFAFNNLINPDLKTAYTSVPGGMFVNVTNSKYWSTSLTKTTTLRPYGKIPKAVSEICKLTYYCSLGNIHANTKGYTDIGKLIKTAVG